MDTLEQFLIAANSAVKPFNAAVEGRGLVGLAGADHLGYKCGTSTEFESLRAIFEGNSDFVYQSIISSRRIAIIRLKTEIPTICGGVMYLELSDQKPDQSQKSGFDHMELYPIKGTAEELAKDLEEKGFEISRTERPHHTTYDAVLTETFKFRIEAEPLISKIVKEEIGLS